MRPFSSDVYLVKRTDGRINIELQVRLISCHTSYDANKHNCNVCHHQNPLLIVGDVKIDFTQKIKLDIMNIMGR